MQRRNDMIKLGTLAAAAVIAMCSFSTDASAARGGVAHFGGGGARIAGATHFNGGVAHFRGPRVAGNVGGWNGYRRYGFRRDGYGGLGYGWSGWGYPAYAYAGCYVWTPLGYMNECGYDYSYDW
jgi:hypothetical protein